MTTLSHDLKNSGIPLEAPTTSLGIPLLVTTSKYQPLLPTSPVANANQPQPTSSARSSRQHLRSAAASHRSNHSNRQPEPRQRSASIQPDNPITNVNYDDIMRNLKNIAKYVRTKRSRQDPELEDDATSHFFEVVESSAEF